MAIQQYMIGSTLETMTNLESLNPPVHPPKSAFVPYSVPLDLGDGRVRGAGWSSATWTWNVIRQAERDKLRGYCSGASAAVYIKTRCNDSSDLYKIYQCQMIWPQEEARDASRRTSFVIQFRALIEVILP